MWIKNKNKNLNYIKHIKTHNNPPKKIKNIFKHLKIFPKYKYKNMLVCTAILGKNVKLK